MKSLSNKKFINAIVFQLGWFGCILGGDSLALPLLFVLLIFHYAFMVSQSAEWLLIAVVTLLGFIVDSFLTFFNVFQFSSVSLGPIPIWLICLWCVFSTSLCHSLSWLRDKLILASLLGSIFGPISYLAGSKMADVVIVEPTIHSLLLIGLCWAILFPLMMIMVRRVYASR